MNKEYVKEVYEANPDLPDWFLYYPYQECATVYYGTTTEQLLKDEFEMLLEDLPKEYEYLMNYLSFDLFFEEQQRQRYLIEHNGNVVEFALYDTLIRANIDDEGDDE